jgi:hypothetical protein
MGDDRDERAGGVTQRIVRVRLAKERWLVRVGVERQRAEAGLGSP